MKFLLLAAIAVGLWLWLRPKKAALSVGEARRVLELRPDATRDDIVAAHRRLIRKVHPDAGGSSDLTRRVNAARDILLAQVNRTDTKAL
ncbi:J domain-containing protein [Sphingomonas sp. ID0503]|uniref:J domain-containing protein n=1 Tax=Sphingomonas sp. ID0503 TaxID=3399691 RepID=UPI003AFA42F9